MDKRTDKIGHIVSLEAWEVFAGSAETRLHVSVPGGWLHRRLLGYRLGRLPENASVDFMCGHIAWLAPSEDLCVDAAHDIVVIGRGGTARHLCRDVPRVRPSIARQGSWVQLRGTSAQ